MSRTSLFLFAALIGALAGIATPAKASPPPALASVHVQPTDPLAVVLADAAPAVGIHAASPLATVLADAGTNHDAPDGFLETVKVVVKAAALNAAMNPTVWGILLAIAFAFFARKNDKKAAFIKSAIEKAFHIVEDLKAAGQLPAAAQKPVIALEQLEKILNQQGLTITDEVKALALATWSAMHGEQKAGIVEITAIDSAPAK